MKDGQFTTAQVRELIRNQFGIEYTMKQVWVILKKMNMRHAKPYNADDILKKLRHSVHGLQSMAKY